jgi:hypothetical protein
LEWYLRDLAKFGVTLARLARAGKRDEGLQLLHEARVQAEHEADAGLLEEVLTHLVFFYGWITPPDLDKVKFHSLEREHLFPTGYNKVQTAMVFYWTIGDSERAAEKATEGVKLARAEGDTRTTYQGLGLLGLALLDLKRQAEVLTVFEEIRQMVSDKANVVVGDETLFLERLQATGQEPRSLRETAKVLASACRDEDFVKRLRALSEPTV